MKCCGAACSGVRARRDLLRYVKFRILSDHNGADYQKRVEGPDWSMVGLSEVKFYCRRDRTEHAAVTRKNR